VGGRGTVALIMPTRRLAILLCSALTLTACGGETKKAGPTADEKAAEAKKKEQEEADAKAVAERKAKREADEKAKAEADAKVKAELDKLIVLPAKLPKDPVAACDDAGKAQDAFVRRVNPDGVKAWDEGGKDKAIPMTVVQCTQADSLEAAACMKNAFDGAGAELKDAAKQISQACIDKFPSKTKKPPGGAMPKKRPGG
jgi:predicted small secreted protein